MTVLTKEIQPEKCVAGGFALLQTYESAVPGTQGTARPNGGPPSWTWPVVDADVVGQWEDPFP